MKLKHEFQNYLKAAYPDQPLPNSEQWRQLRDAFYAGCLVGHNGEDYVAELMQFGRDLKKGQFDA